MGGIVYVAYKLEPEPCYSDEEDVAGGNQEPVLSLAYLEPTTSYHHPLPGKKHKNDVKERKERAKTIQTKASDVTFDDKDMTTKGLEENIEEFRKMEQQHSITERKTKQKPDKTKAVKRNKKSQSKKKDNALKKIQSKDTKKRKRRYDINIESTEQSTQEKKKKKDQVQKPNDERTNKDAIVRRKEQITEEKKKKKYQVMTHNDEITKNDQIISNLEINLEMKEKWKLEEKTKDREKIQLELNRQKAALMQEWERDVKQLTQKDVIELEAMKLKNK